MIGSKRAILLNVVNIVHLGLKNESASDLEANRGHLIILYFNIKNLT